MWIKARLKKSWDHSPVSFVLAAAQGIVVILMAGIVGVATWDKAQALAEPPEPPTLVALALEPVEDTQAPSSPPGDGRAEATPTPEPTPGEPTSAERRPRPDPRPAPAPPTDAPPTIADTTEPAPPPPMPVPEPQTPTPGPVAAVDNSCTEDITWIPIQGGSFMMGSEKGEPEERPVHRVTLSPFTMSRTEVTVRQYQACVKAGACREPEWSEYCNYDVVGRECHPVNCVDWEQAAAYARWKGAALPTEAQWEYAARGQAGREYPWGDAPPTCDLAVYSDTPCDNSSTAPVCSRPRGNTPEGLCDMAGNVWEWTADWYDANYYATLKAGATDPTGPAGPLSGRVVRGGSWNGYARWLRGSFRSWGRPSRRSDYHGFRVVVPSSPGHAP